MIYCNLFFVIFADKFVIESFWENMHFHSF